MFDFLYNSSYINAKFTEDYFHFGKVRVPSPNWNDVLKEFDREYKIHLTTDYKDICKFQDRFGFVLHEFHAIPIIYEFMKAIGASHKFRGRQHYTALAYISLSSESATYGRHRDTMDVWCWQMLGYTHWKVEGKKRDFEKILEPGELIYIPRGMWHETKPMTPRVGLSFGSEDVKT